MKADVRSTREATRWVSRLKTALSTIVRLFMVVVFATLMWEPSQFIVEVIAENGVLQSLTDELQTLRSSQNAT